MILKNIPFALVLTLAAAFIVGCGPENNLSKDDVAYIKRKKFEEMYPPTTSTVTVTKSKTEVVTISNTVTQTI